MRVKTNPISLTNILQNNIKMDNCNIFEIWEDYKAALLAYIRKRVQDQDDAKDILQDVLLKSYQYCSKGQTVMHIKAWLYKITQNAIIDYHKKAQSRRPISFDIMDDHSEKSLLGEASDYIKILLRLLPDDYAKPLYLYDVEGLDQKTIAENLKLSLTNTKTRIQRARLKLKEQFLACCVVGFGENGEMVSFDIKPQCLELQAEKNKLEKTS